MKILLAPRVLALLVLMGTAQARAEFLIFNSLAPGQNAATRADWLAASGIAAPDHLVDFESGLANGQNISGVTGLFPSGLVISDTSGPNSAIVRSGNGSIGNSDPVGTFSLTHNEDAFLEFDFSASPVDYVGFLDIDQAGIAGILTFVGGETVAFSLEATGADGNTAEFAGFFRNDRPGIARVQLDASGDGRWGVDDIEYGVVAGAVPEPASLAMTGLGLAGMGLLARRRSRSGADANGSW